MKYKSLEGILDDRNPKQVLFDTLMPVRIQRILLVSSVYDSYTFVEDGRLHDMIFSEYLDLNLRYAPRVDRVSTAKKALEMLKADRYDLVISMLRVGDMHIREFGKRVNEIFPGLPVIVLAFSARELSMLPSNMEGIDRAFVWNGDVRLFLAMIKYVEDRLNAWHDASIAGVQSLILIEDNVRFYSSYLSILYTEIMQQTQMLMSDGLNRMQRQLRQHARPKILLATSYEEGLLLYNRYHDYLLGVIADAAFPRNGKTDSKAGIDFAKMVKNEQPDLAVLVQSSDPVNEVLAHNISAAFIDKKSPSLLHDVRNFMQAELGFGDFVFRRTDASVVTTASDLRSITEALKVVPEESLIHHGHRKDFSTWLMARTEFDLAKSIKHKQLSDYSSPEEFRKHLITALSSHRIRSRAGIVSDFSAETFEGGIGFAKIGSGSLGGKGRGLAFVNALLADYQIYKQVPGVRVFVPPAAVLATDTFDQFIENSVLSSFLLNETDDNKITKAIMDAKLPEEIVEQLRTLISRVRYPLAVRSSSLLEDASYQPFAGIYSTYMIPNNNESSSVRLKELINAVKLVYASTYHADARGYLDQTPNRLEEEKMAVVIQQMVGRRYENYLYPTVAGVIRSHNFYPMKGMKAADGVICPVLGLGKVVMEGGRCLRFSPQNINAVYESFTARDYVNNAQRDFCALDLSKPGPLFHDQLESNIATLSLDMASRHGTFEKLGQVYAAQTRTMQDASFKPGMKLVTMAGLLNEPDSKLSDALAFVLAVGKAAMSCPVEIEFAANIRPEKERAVELGILQIRPMIIDSGTEHLDVKHLDKNNSICVTSKALGHGSFSNIKDVVFVKPETFNRTFTRDISHEIAEINADLKQKGRQYLLIGPGRWGSNDQNLGIPVLWSQISQVSCIIETELKDLRVAPSQGSHFFQNITSFGIGYFTINSDLEEAFLDIDWLSDQKASLVKETHHTKHLRFEHPMDINVDSRTGVGVVMKPGIQAKRHN